MQFETACQSIRQLLEQGLSHALTYHGLHHTLDVVEATERIAAYENISGEDLALLITAAWLHDSGYLHVYHQHEEEGCKIAQMLLPNYGYSEEQIQKICAIILATRIPQTPSDALSAILCDADLDYLGREDYGPISRTLVSELNQFSDIMSEYEWFKLQRDFLRRHQYFTPYSQKFRQSIKEKHLAEIENWLTLQPEQGA